MLDECFFDDNVCILQHVFKIDQSLTKVLYDYGCMHVKVRETIYQQGGERLTVIDYQMGKLVTDEFVS